MADVRLDPSGPGPAGGLVAVAAIDARQPYSPPDAETAFTRRDRSDDVAAGPVRVRHSIVGRIMLGLVLLVVLAGGGAWLMHASIDPDGPVLGPSNAQDDGARVAG